MTTQEIQKLSDEDLETQADIRWNEVKEKEEISKKAIAEWCLFSEEQRVRRILKERGGKV